MAILATGSELVPQGAPLGPGQIRNSNSYTARARCWPPAVSPCLGIARDDLEETRRLIARALEEDVALTSGGVSVASSTSSSRCRKSSAWSVAFGAWP